MRNIVFPTHRPVSLLAIGVIAVLLLGILPPVVFLAFSSLSTSNLDGSFGAATLDNFREILFSPKLYQNLLNSSIYSLGSAIFALLIGMIQAWLAERTDAPMRGVLYFVSIASLGIPYVLYIVAWLLFLGKAGPANAWIGALVGEPGVYINVYSIGGMIFIEGLMWSPMAFLILAAVFRNADASYEEAAMMSGARLPAVVRYVTFALVRPALFALALLVFIKASEAFEVPALVGMPGSISVLTTVIYEAVRRDIPPNFNVASAFAVLLLILMGVLLSFYSRISAQAHKYRTVTGKGFRPRILKLGRWRYLAGALIIFLPLVVIVIPLVTILWAALLPYYQVFSLAGLKLLTLQNFVDVLNAGSFAGSISNTLILGAAAATAVTSFCSLAGWCIARRVSGAGFIDALAATPLIFPAIVLGIAFVEVFVHLGSLYGSLTSIVLVSAVAYVPYGVRYAQLGALQIHPELEEAAVIAGANQVQIFGRIIVPLMGPALVSCWLFVFLIAVRAVSMILMLVGPDSQVVAVGLFDLWNNGQVGELAALGCVWTGIVTVFSLIFYFVARRFQLPVG